MGALRAGAHAARLLVILAACLSGSARGGTCVLGAGGSESSSLTIPFSVPVAVEKRDSDVEQELITAAQKLWTTLSTPHRVSRGIWFVWNVQGIEVGPLREAGSTASRLVRYAVRPVVSFSPDPPAPPPAPAPRILGADPGETDLCVSSEFPLELAELALGEHMFHQDFLFTEGYTSRVSGVRITVEGGTPRVHIDLDGAIPGTVTLIGVPEYQTEVESLLFPTSVRVEYSGPTTLSPRALIGLQERIAGKPFWRLKTDMEYTANKLGAAIRKSLGSAFEVTITSVQLRDIRISAEAFTILVRAQGKVALAGPAAPR